MRVKRQWVFMATQDSTSWARGVSLMIQRDLAAEDRTVSSSSTRTQLLMIQDAPMSNPCQRLRSRRLNRRRNLISKLEKSLRPALYTSLTTEEIQPDRNPKRRHPKVTWKCCTWMKETTNLGRQLCVKLTTNPYCRTSLGTLMQAPLKILGNEMLVSSVKL